MRTWNAIPERLLAEQRSFDTLDRKAIVPTYTAV